MECQRTERDLRIDFLRGAALIIIFVDHVHGNTLSHLTPRNFGFSNAADLFVFLAGVSAALAYWPKFSTHGLASIRGKLMRRVAQIYSAHLVVLWLSIVVLLFASHVLHRADFLGHELPSCLATDAWHAVWSSLVLTLQPEYLDILPLYVVLLLSLPAFLLLERFHRGVGLVVSIALWLAAEIAGLNLPSSRSSAGWYFDVFAWQLLFYVGLMAGAAHLRGAKGVY